MYETDLYFESHITLSPVFGDDLEWVKMLTQRYGFRIADLLMQKRKVDTPTRSKYDTFCTTRSKSYEDILQRTESCVYQLQFYGYEVWRYKIENTLLDVRLGEQDGIT